MAGSILIVDDEEGVRNMLTDTFEDFGYRVAVCKDGADAVEFYRGHHAEIDLVIMDVTMPRMSGPECLAQLRIINPSVRVIVSSGFVFDGDVQAMMEQGAIRFIQKPVDIDVISDLVKSVLGTGTS
jgi:DNA-binding NtrC family response regulator